MPGIDLAALSGADLRRLLKVAHTRRDGLLSDRLEWEIAARAASGVRAPARFAPSPRNDDERDSTFHMSAADEGAAAGDLAAKAPRSVLLVTLGAAAGSLASAALFWGLEQSPPPGRTPPPAMASATLASRPALAALGPEPSAPALGTPIPVETAPADAAPGPAPAPKAQRRVAKTPARTMVAQAERPPRPPNLAEWLAGPPEEPIH